MRALDCALPFPALAEAARAAEADGEDAVLLAGPGGESFALAAALAQVTGRIGLVVEAQALTADPYNLARSLASLDHISGGRAGLLLRAELGAAEAALAGLAEVPPPARAEELVVVLRGLLETWAPGAFPRDKATGVNWDRAKMRYLNHVGPHFRVRGPLDVERAPQVQPPILARAADAVAVGFADLVVEDLPPARPGATLRARWGLPDLG